MRIHVHDTSSYIGKAIAAAAQAQSIPLLAEPDAAETEPTNAGGFEDEWGATPAFFDAEKSKRHDKAYDACIYELAGSPNSAAIALDALSRQRGSKKEKVFIAITSPLTWARINCHPPAPAAATRSTGQADPTQSDPNAALDQAAAALSQSQHLVSADTASTAALEEDASPPQPPADLTSADADRRMATANARGILEAERSILAAAMRRFKTYVICPGLLYGDGETAAGLHSLFRTAWEASPNSPVPIFGSGSNILPTMHLADFAAYVTAVCVSPPAQQYLLAADDSRLTQHEIVTAVAAKMGNSNIKELALQDFMFQQGIEHMLMSLPLVCTPVTPAPALQYKDGLIAHLDAVLQQYIAAHHLQPLRLFITGAPAAGKSDMAARLAKHYQLQIVTARTILAAAEEVGGTVKQEMQADLGSKSGRVSDATMLKLCRHVMGKREPQWKGFILEGWPKTPDQAEQLFTEDQPYTPEERVRLEALKELQAGANRGKPAKPDPKGKKPELPKRRIAVANLFPSHVFDLQAPEAALLARSIALGDKEAAAAGAVAGKPGAAKGAPLGGKGGPVSHNNEKDFKRRYAAYKSVREGDEAFTNATQAAAQLLWDDQRTQLEAAAAVEAEALAAAAAKAQRYNQLTSMKSTMKGTMKSGTLKNSLGSSRAVSRMGSVANSRAPSRAPTPPSAEKAIEPPPPPPKGPATLALEDFIAKGPPQFQHKGLLTIFEQHGAQVTVMNTAEILDEDGNDLGAPTLDDLTDNITSLVGSPHNYSVEDPTPTPQDDASAHVTEELTEAEEAAEQAAGETSEAADTGPSPEEIEEEKHVQKTRTDFVAMRAQPMRRYLMSKLMPVLAKAILEAQTEHPTELAGYVARQLLKVGKQIDVDYIDPYAAEVYGVQRSKWDAKRAREAHKQALLDAKVVPVSDEEFMTG